MKTGTSLILKQAKTLTLRDRPVTPSKRFWNSLQIRFGFTANIFRYFTHAEVFRRISLKAPDDKIRYCLEKSDDSETPTLLSSLQPESRCHSTRRTRTFNADLWAKEYSYHDGVIRSYHMPRHSSPFTISGDGFEAQYVDRNAD